MTIKYLIALYLTCLDTLGACPTWNMNLSSLRVIKLIQVKFSNGGLRRLVRRR